jgi:hypothetical protein
MQNVVHRKLVLIKCYRVNHIQKLKFLMNFLDFVLVASSCRFQQWTTYFRTRAQERKILLTYSCIQVTTDIIDLLFIIKTSRSILLLR